MVAIGRLSQHLKRLSPVETPPADAPFEPVDSVELQGDSHHSSTNWTRGLALGLLAATAAVQAQPQVSTQQLASALLETRGPAAPSAAEATQLSQRLAGMDRGVLKLLQADGVKFGVVHPGTSFIGLGVVPARTLDSYPTARMRAQAEAAQQAVRYHNSGLDSLYRQRDQAADKGPLDERIRQLQGEKRRALLEALPADALVAPYRIPSLAAFIRDADGLHALVQQQAVPKGTALMARYVGAQTADQVKEYQALLEAINGPRLQEAQAHGLSQATPAQRLQWQKDPGQIPLDLKRFDILVPDLAYAPDGQGGAVRVSLEDASVVGAWANAQGKTVAAGPQGSTINGQYFPGTRQVLIQSNRVAPTLSRAHAHTPVHESGHAVEDSVSRHDPQFYRGWKSRLDRAYQRAAAVGESGTITGYATTNPAEYVAEGVGHFLEDPATLKARDPQLSQLSQELLERAAQLGRALP